MFSKGQGIDLSKVKVATKSDILKGKALAVKVGDEEVAVYHTADDQWYATAEICTHEYCNLAQDGGKLDGYEVECDCHGSKFDVRTGAVLLSPAVEPLKSFKVSIVGEDVLIED